MGDKLMAIHNNQDKIIESIDHLPSFPDVALRVLNLAGSPDSNVNDIVKVIKYDQAVTANCLKLCNSSYFGLREKVQSIKQALVLLGTDNVIKIVVANCSKMSAFAKAQKGYGLEPGELWKHSVACAILSQLLIKKVGQKDNHELFTAVLLHDIGKLVIDRFIADDAEVVYSLMLQRGFGFVEAEKEFFGIDHAELGGKIARTWNFPQSLIDAIQNHHQSLSSESEANLESWTGLSNLVYHLIHKYASIPQYHGITCRISQEILDCFGLSQTDMDEVFDEFPNEMKKAEDFLK